MQYIFHSSSAENLVTRSLRKGVYFYISVHKGVGSKKEQRDEGALLVNGPPPVSSYTTPPYSPRSPWLQMEWKKMFLNLT
jgi:hypothetical protein